MSARYYDPQVGRFASRDSMLDQIPYAYCGGEPNDWLDPSGCGWSWRRALKEVGKNIGTLIGGTVGGIIGGRVGGDAGVIIGTVGIVIGTVVQGGFGKDEDPVPGAPEVVPAVGLPTGEGAAEGGAEGEGGLEALEYLLLAGAA